MQFPAREGPLIMGILNLTPDSFSDGGRYQDPDQAVRHALRMVAEGADLVDVGGESTRPGSDRVSAGEQCRRTLETIRRLREQLPEHVPISIDTTLAEVAAAAVDAGASVINDISAGREDGEMLCFAARHRLPLILMHMQGEPLTMQRDPHYVDVLGEVCAFLQQRIAAALEAGVAPQQIILDPGIGFGKTSEHNFCLLAGLQRIVRLGYPVLLGVSRKRFIRELGRAPVQDWIGACCACTALGVRQGVRLFRVHDVHPNRQAADLAWRLARPRAPEPAGTGGFSPPPGGGPMPGAAWRRPG